MSVEELDRLFAHRKEGKFINSASRFQEVTQISDSLLAVISPHFTFPRWTQNGNRANNKAPLKNALKTTPKVIDLNVATSEQLKTINGIGDKLSARIIKFRDRLGGFLIDEQLYDVYGLRPEVVKRALIKFKVIDPPKIQKININNATMEELSRLVYINRVLAEKIILYRVHNGAYDSLDKLRNVESFPAERIDRIKLYLTL